MRRPVSWFWPALAAVGLAGLGVRLMNVLVWRPTVSSCDSVDRCYEVGGDALYSHLQGEFLAQGRGFVSSAAWVSFREFRPGAGDPPIYVLFLGLVSELHGSAGVSGRLAGLGVLVALVAAAWWIADRVYGTRGGRIALGVAGGTAALLIVVSLATSSPVTAHRLASGVAGAGGVVLAGLVGRRLAGSRAGLIAAGLAAGYPLLWINDAMLLSESLYVPLLLVAVLAAYRFWDRPSWGSCAVLGLAIAVAALTRAEAALLYGFLVVPLVWGIRGADLGRRVAYVGLAAGLGLAAMAPWFAYNLSRFDEPVLMTSGTGAVLSAGSCDTAFYGEFAGYYGADCFGELVVQGRAEWPDTSVDESVRDIPAREAALEYLGDHRGRLPAVMALRVGRMWDVYKPAQNTELNINVEGRGRWASWLGLWLYYPVTLAAMAGIVVLARRRIPVSPLLAVVATVTVTAAMTFGVTRYRAPADAVLVIAAAVAIDALVARRWARPDRGSVARRGRADAPDRSIVEDRVDV